MAPAGRDIILAGLDSATPPNAASVAAARAAGVQLWSGYLQTHGGVGLYHAWSHAEFEVARGCGATPIAYASGWDDPAACKALAASWNVRLCLDVEGGIRGDGVWVQPWLDASGAGLYGNAGVFAGRRAAFFILAGYYGFDPGATWRGTPPPVPHGFQWQGTHDEFGIGVDRSWLDDWFAQGDDMTPEEHQWLADIHGSFDLGVGGTINAAVAQPVADIHASLGLGSGVTIQQRVDELKTAIAAIKPTGGTVDLTDVNKKLDRLIRQLNTPP